MLHPKLARFVAAQTLLLALPSIVPAAVESARAETCFAVDGDGTYDQDGVVNGVITISSTSSVPPAATPYDCAVLSFVVQSGATLTLEGSETTGEIAALNAGDLTIESGGVISADREGCRSQFNGSFPVSAEGPDTNNICSNLSFIESAGGGYGGKGGLLSFTYGSATKPLLFGSTGRIDGFDDDGGGGAGGGVVSITAATLTHDGVISANGGPGRARQVDGDTRFSGGGSGGSIDIVAATINGTTGTFAAKGGDALGDAGGGGGGRIAIAYQGGGYDFDQGDFDVAGGAAVFAGEKGTVYLHDTSARTVRIFHGFTFDEENYVESQWIADESATNQYCAPPSSFFVRSSITAENVILGGAIDCDLPFRIAQTGPSGALKLLDGASLSVRGAVTLDAATSLDVGTNVTIANTLVGTDLSLVLPDGDDQSWSAVTISGAAEGRVVIDAAIALALAGGTSVQGNPAWTNLTALEVDATSSIDADGTGCQAPRFEFSPKDGTAPVGENVCTIGEMGGGEIGVYSLDSNRGGGGGGGHGGAGGAGAKGAGGATYDSQTRLFGASAASSFTSRVPGGSGLLGGAGGGLVEIAVNGTFTNDGSISARGTVGSSSGLFGNFLATGGGAGGSIHVKASEYACDGGTGSFSAAGGDGSGTAGGGGGGRLLIDVAFDSCLAAPLSALEASSVVPGGSGNGGAGNGTVGKLVFARRALGCADPVGIKVSREQEPAPHLVEASDALFVLSAAIGSEPCDLCVCDANGSGAVTAADALITLRVAVGADITLQCPACS